MFTISEQRRDGVFDNRAERDGCKKIERSCVFTSCVPGVCSKYGRWSAMVHCGSIRQTAQILQMSKECLRTGDKAVVRFKFIKNPEYMKPGQRMVFREGRTKAVGNVITPLYTPGSVQQRTKPNKMQGRGVNPASQSNAPKPLSKITNDAVAAQSSLTGNTMVLDIGTDKRNNRSSNNHKKFRGGTSTNLDTGGHDTSTASSQQSSTFCNDSISVASN
ncbi:hypothetical protein RP20_CCG028405 [Aedes albopictus]|nr:hypothetical protein RP20_CCG028405 [Aedes albopictus]